jgi:hypothetical protein
VVNDLAEGPREAGNGLLRGARFFAVHCSSDVIFLPGQRGLQSTK